jgi:hypothetical protein|tara:strand:- start:460 stop:645 length:186 start_codon:yes stop_codon:yes gene_type:complete
MRNVDKYGGIGQEGPHTLSIDFGGDYGGRERRPSLKELGDSREIVDDAISEGKRRGRIGEY